MPRDPDSLPFPALHPQTGHGDVRDVFAKLTRQTPRDPAGEWAFREGKRHLIRTHPGLTPSERKRLLEELESHFKRISTPELPPVPGGVGYGMFYNTPFKNDFATGTGIYWEVICPQPPGGNITTYFYLTATNRSARGVEAFISYDGQTQTAFKVFDWSRADPWQINVPFASLAPYLKNGSAHGNAYSVLPILNWTIQESTGNWYNQSWLLKQATGVWELYYEHHYTATLADQQAGFVGSWGPIVETFQPAYMGTSPMGTLQTKLIGRNVQGVWGAWHLLAEADALVRDDHKGFGLQFLDVNHTWAVKS